MTASELITLVTQELKSLSDKLVTVDYTNAVSNAERDCGWALPQTTDFRIKWLKQRTIRSLMNMLWIESAARFRVDTIYLQQSFSHYGKIINAMDEEFEAIKIEASSEFTDAESYDQFGSVISAGFSRNALGQDTTYRDDNEVIIS